MLVDDVAAATAKAKSLGDDLQGRHGGDGSGLLLDHHRSDRRGDRALATEGEMTRERGQPGSDVEFARIASASTIPGIAASTRLPMPLEAPPVLVPHRQPAWRAARQSSSDGPTDRRTTAKIGREVRCELAPVRTRSGDVPARVKDGAYVIFKAAM